MKTTLLRFSIIMIIAFTCYSCKKEKSPIPTPVSSTTHYILSSPRQHDEAADIYVYDNAGVQTISVPIQSAYPDTLGISFSQPVNILPLRVTGGAVISGTTLTLSYNEWNITTNAFNWAVNSAVYVQH